MRISAAAFFMILTTIFLSACESQQMADLDDHGMSYYSRNGVMSLMAGASMDQSMGHMAMNPAGQSVPFGTGPSVPAPGAAAATTASAAPAQMASGSWQWPVDGKVIESYGQKSDGVSNEGIVIAASEGAPICAVQAGEVAFVGNDAKNYGNIVILRHAGGDMTSYSHAKDITVKKGDNVAAGSVIAHVGQSGNARTPQLHFAVRAGTSSVDPMTRLPQQVAALN